MQQTMANMQQAQGQRIKPPTFSHSVEPMDVDDYLKTIEKKLQVVQCTNREGIFFAAH
jgi:hypothetical protein